MFMNQRCVWGLYMKKNFFQSLIAVLMLLMHLPAISEDVDLFVGGTPASTDLPNVLIILDNTGNWSSPFSNEMAALSSLFTALPPNKFRVGLMMFTETGSGDTGNDGAYVRAAIRTMDSTNLARYAAMVNGFNVVNDKGNAGKSALSMVEAYRYFSAGTPYAGNKKNKTDYTGNVYNPNPAELGNQLAASRVVWATTGNALSSKEGSSYNNPIVSGCAKNYIIYISNGAAQDSNATTTAATSALTFAGGSTTAIPLNPAGSQDNMMDEWARFMKKSNLDVSVYTVDVNKVTTGQGPGWTALLKSTAAVSSGKYFDVSSTGSEIVNALNGIFSEIQSVNSAFASVSLPVSVNTQGTFLNQVFVGMFRPNQDAYPRWAGNLKQYKFGFETGSTTLDMLDAADKGAVNSTTGFIKECARSYWTPATLDSEWASQPKGECLTIANSDVSNYPDGNVVEKGGQAYKLRGSSTRTVKTCSPTMASCQTTLTTFDNSNVTQTMLGAASTTERDNLINWAIGQYVAGDGNDAATTFGNRLSAHGDVIHSRPVAINFGTAAAPNVVVFYGGNDGLLRAVNGNRSAAIGSIPAGGELWSFMPPEFYSKIKRIRDNTTLVSFPNITGTPTPLPKPYGVDGPITAFDGKISTVDKKFIYASMRRGGRSIYAFDVTNTVSSPSSPTLKWKIGCPNATDDTGCTDATLVANAGNMTGIGQTWSSPKALSVSNYGAGASPLMIFGGGYDTCEDFDNGTANNNCSSSSKGHYVYVIDANSGAVVRAFNTGGTRGVVADSTLVLDATGKAIYAYTADLGGNVYRISFGGTTASDWSMTKIASLGCNVPTAGCTANRKFMYAPSVVATGGNYVILLGSGDREKPLTFYAATTAVSNYFFMFTDKPSLDSATWPGNADGCGGNIVCKASLFPIATATTTAQVDAGLVGKKGWYLELTSTEQVVTPAVTAFGVVSFSTHQPAVPVSGQCSNLGTARAYNFAYANAARVAGNNTDLRYVDAPPGLSPPPVIVTVTLDDGTTHTVCVGCAGGLITKEVVNAISAIQAKRRLYWYLQK
jgi:type IV pilus assembly protein PilY1